jgi:hypothetical protein
MIRPSSEDEHDRNRAQREPIVLSPEYRAAIAEVEAMRSNQDGADKSWVHRAMEDVRRHFANVRRA